MSHTPDQLRSFMTEYFRRAYDENDPSAIDQFISPHILNHGLAPQPTTTRQAFKDWYTPFRAAFSSVSCKIDRSIVEGDWICCRVTFTASHTGPHLGPPPSHKKVTLHALILVRWHNGQAVEAYNEFDQLALMKQIGAA